MRRIIPFALSVLVVQMFVARAHAAGVVEVTNIGNSQDVGTTLNFAGTSVRAGAFTTGATSASWTLDSITAHLSGQTNGADSSVQMSLYTDSFGLPGAPIETLAGNPIPAGVGDHTFTSSGTTLSPNTTYWAVLTKPSGTTLVEWVGTSNFAESSPDGWTIENRFAFSEDAGANWGQNGGFSEIFSVSVVPEPGTAALIALATLGVTLRRRRAA